MAEGDHRPEEVGTQQAQDEQLGPVARVIVGALALPVAGLVAAGVLLLVGLSLAVAGLVLLAALLAGVVSVPLRVLAGRRRIRRPAGASAGQVIDAEASVRVIDPAPEDKRPPHED